MKAISKLIALILVFNVYLTQAQDKVIVEGEKKLNVDFTKFKTFNWVSESDKNSDLIIYSYEEYSYPDTKSVKQKTGKGKSKPHQEAPVKVYSYSYAMPAADVTVNNTVVNATEAELEGRGYKKDEASPDLLIAYRIFDRSTKVKGYDGEPTTVGSTEVREAKDTITYKLKPGSIMISIIDRKSGDAIWEGFASGVARADGFINDEQKIKEAINLIFQKYEWRGDKVSMN